MRLANDFVKLLPALPNLGTFVAEHGDKSVRAFARWVASAELRRHVRYGSLADMAPLDTEVCFTPTQIKQRPADVR